MLVNYDSVSGIKKDTRCECLLGIYRIEKIRFAQELEPPFLRY